MRVALLIASLLVLVLGLGCLNYTTDGKAAHHREWAQEHGYPEPSNALFVTGLVCTAGGAGLAGFLLGRRLRPAE